MSDVANGCDLEEVKHMAIQKFKELARDLSEWAGDKHSKHFVNHKRLAFEVYFDNVFHVKNVTLSLGGVETDRVSEPFDHRPYTTTPEEREAAGEKYSGELEAYNAHYLVVFVRQFVESVTCHKLMKALNPPEKKPPRKPWWRAFP